MKKLLLLVLTVVLCGVVSAQESCNALISNDSPVCQNDAAIAKNADADTVGKQNSTLVMRVVDWYNHNLNYVTVTLLMTLESSFIPFPSEVVVPPAAYQACNVDNPVLYVTSFPLVNILIVVLVATLGALIGAFINYYLAFFLGRPIVYWFADSKVGHLFLLSSEKVKRAEDYFIEHGNSSTFIGRLVPGIRQLISIPAGLAKMKLGPFILFTILGSGSWNIILAILGFVAHGQQDLINEYSHELSYILLGLGILFILYLIYKAVVKKKNSKTENPESSSKA